MIINIDNTIAKKYDTVEEDILVLYMISKHINIDNIIEKLIQQQYITASTNNKLLLFSKYLTTNIGEEILGGVLLDSDIVVGSTEVIDRIDSLIPRIQSCYPQGKKNGTAYYWRGNKVDIKRKLQSFLKKYGDIYTDVELIEATNSYVLSFNGNYQYMRLLQYFIWKEEVKNGEKSTISELANYLENRNQDNTSCTDWTSTLK